MPLNLILSVLFIAAPFVTYGAMAVRERIVVSGAIKAERAAGIVACNSRVSQIEAATNAAVAAGIADANSAANEIGVTPAAAAELQAICDMSASCRSRRVK